jgi:methionyl-tRNA formyltransferase
MRLVFFGSGAFGLPTLEHLLDHHQVALAVTQPDRPAGRGGRLTPTPVAAHLTAAAPHVALLKPDRVNEPEVVQQIRQVQADAWVVIAFGQKLGRRLLECVVAVNLHGSRLPRWRGAAPIHHAVLAGDAVTGVSVITLADAMDAGDVLAITSRPVGPTDTTGDLHDLLARDGVAAVEQVLAHYASGRLRPQPQDAAFVTLAPKLGRDDARLDLSASADEVRRRINGLSPWPGCALVLAGQRLKILRAGPAEGHAPGSGPPGCLLDPAQGVIACGRGAVRLLQVQPEGGRAMAFEDYARGRTLSPGAELQPG